MIKAIETEYDDYRFRSRLEARWAVFFKTLGIKYEYEKEGYDLDGIWYLPDFWFPRQQIWVEIKGENSGDDVVTKADRLVRYSKKGIAVCVGSIEIPHSDAFSYIWNSEIDNYHVFMSPMWCECPTCGNLEMTAEGRLSWTSCNCLSVDEKKELRKAERHAGNKSSARGHSSPRLIDAYIAARQARFEHGERG